MINAMFGISTQDTELYDTESELPPETTAKATESERVVFATSESASEQEEDFFSGGEEFTIVREEEEETTEFLAGILSATSEEGEELFGSNTTSSPQLLPPECLAVLGNLTSDSETFDLAEAMALG